MAALHPQSSAHLRRATPAPAETDPVRAARRRVREESAAWDGPRVEVPQVDEVAVASQDVRVPARRYRGLHGSADVLVYAHGGGFVAGDLDTVDAVCRRTAARSGWTVVSVDYRRAPEHPFPAALIDVESVTRWVLGGMDEGAAPRRVVVGGESAGGNLAAVVARRLSDQLHGQLLVYPLTACRVASWSHREFASGYGLTTERLDQYWAWYLPSGADPASEDVSPLMASNLAGLPPACVIVAACDPLRADGEEYARRLLDHGVDASCSVFDGMIHGFFRLAGAFDAALEADELIEAWLNR